MSNVTTIKSLAKTLIQAALEKPPYASEFNLAVDPINYLTKYRTVGFTLPEKMVDYTMFTDLLVDPNCVAKVIVPNIDGWKTMADAFNHELGPVAKFKVYNESGYVTDAYIHGSKQHLKLADKLGIDYNHKEIIRLSPISFMVNGIIKDAPRGFSFDNQATINGFVVKQLMARYLGKVEIYRDIAYSIEHNRAALAQIDPNAERTKLDVVVIYHASRFFDKVRRNKFYSWLATQCHADTKVILVN